FFDTYCPHPALPSFPTRRSSDLDGCDGYVSLECAPSVANDTQATVNQTADLWKRVDRPNLMVKIPATDAGVPAIEESIARGINRSEEHTSELQSQSNLVCRLLPE